MPRSRSKRCNPSRRGLLILAHAVDLPLDLQALRRVAIALLASASYARGGGGPPTDAYEGIVGSAIDVHALADIYFAGNFGDPYDSQSELRAFDATANEPAIGWLRVRLAHRPGRFGFRVDLGLGDTATAYFLDDPAHVQDPALSRWLSHRFSDPSGLATGTAQTLDEVTATLEGRRIVRGTTLVSRLEYRHDWSNADSFEHGGRFERTQQTLTLALLASR
jgi:hypothetical protein